MPALGGFEAWVEVEGVRTQEYEVDALEGEPGIISWIPCETGKEFKIGVAIPRDSLQEMSHKARIRLDGVDTILRGNIFQQHTPVPARYFSDQWADAARSATRAFQFGALQLTDDDDYLDQSNEHLGEIRVAIQSVEKFVPVVAKEGGMFNDETKVHERAMKALSTCVRFGETKAHSGAPPKNFVARGVKDICTFVFKYRTMDVLIANDIAPRETTCQCPPPMYHYEASPTPCSVVSRMSVDPRADIRAPHEVERRVQGKVGSNPSKQPRKKRKALDRIGYEDQEPNAKERKPRVKKVNKTNSDSGKKEKVRRRSRETPTWTDDSDDEPLACQLQKKGKLGHRLLSPLRE
ncbi:hypothetical protein NMY22_g2303 [Coprinellus aureogranulatus]|nr:hypothetical protein NMY22_g2303 [Coprinellus aureogranulatus]